MRELLGAWPPNGTAPQRPGPGKPIAASCPAARRAAGPGTHPLRPRLTSGGGRRHAESAGTARRTEDQFADGLRPRTDAAGDAPRRSLADAESTSCVSSFDPSSVPGQFPPGTDERIYELVDLPEVLGDLPELFQRYPEAAGERIQDPGRGLAQPDAAQRIGDRGLLDAVAAVALVLDRHRVGGIERGLRGVHRGGELLLQLLRFPQPLQDVALSLGRRLEELAIGAVSAAGLPVLLAASVVPGAGAGVERADRGLQAGDSGRVGAGSLRAREDGGDRLDQSPVSSSTSARVRSCSSYPVMVPAFRYGTSFQRGRARDPRRNRSESFGATR